MRARSITLRLTLLFSIASAAVLLLVGALIGRQVEDHFEELDLEILQGKLDLVRHSLALGHAPHEQLTARIVSLTAGDDRPVIAVAAPDGGVLFASPGVILWACAIRERDPMRSRTGDETSPPGEPTCR
jgi:two-component system heavy metal sensor histidine kinase CusS